MLVFRLGIVLAVAIYIVMIVVPGRDHVAANADASGTISFKNFFATLITQAEDAATLAPAVRREVEIAARAPRPTAVVATDGGPSVLQTTGGETLELAAFIDPADLLAQNTADEVVISWINVADPQPLVAPGGPPAAPQIWRVTVNGLNFRSGPTTSSAVLDALLLGEEVEYLAEADDGWARLRLLDTGLEGYMVAAYLEPVN